MNNITRHRYPKYVMNAINANIVMKIVDGDFGFVPRKGQKGPRTADGGFYKRIQTWTQQTYGSRIGQGHINKLREEALTVMRVHNPPSAVSVTRTVKPATEAVKLNRLNLTIIRKDMSSGEIAFASSLKEYSKHAPLSIAQVSRLNDMYQQIYVVRCGKK